MTQHYGVSAGPKINPLPSGWMQLTNATTNQPVYYHKATSRMGFFQGRDVFEKPVGDPVASSKKFLSPATLQQSFQLSGEAVSAPFPPTHKESTEGTNKEEAIELLFLSSCSLSSSSVGSELTTISQTLKLRTQKLCPASNRTDDSDSEATCF
jgi:hypothetical protein